MKVHPAHACLRHAPDSLCAALLRLALAKRRFRRELVKQARRDLGVIRKLLAWIVTPPQPDAMDSRYAAEVRCGYSVYPGMFTCQVCNPSAEMPIVPNVWNTSDGVTEEQLAALIPIVHRRTEASLIAAIERGGAASKAVSRENELTADAGHNPSSAPIRLTYDREADAAYLYLKEIAPGEVKRTVFVEKLGDDIALDLDADGRVVGIEFLDGLGRRRRQ